MSMKRIDWVLPSKGNQWHTVVIDSDVVKGGRDAMISLARGRVAGQVMSGHADYDGVTDDCMAVLNGDPTHFRPV